MPVYGIGYFLKGKAQEAAQALRDEFQPVWPNALPVHVTLAIGQLDQPPEDALRRVTDLARARPILPIELINGAHFLPVSNTSYLEVIPDLEIRMLRSYFLKGLGWKPSPFTPHCSITVGKSPEETLAAAERLRARNVRVQDTLDVISLFTETAPGKWERVGDGPLEREWKAQRMGEFFNSVVAGYEEHMMRVVDSAPELYRTIADGLRSTEAPIRILDLGIGTGLELGPIFFKAPNAHVTGIDVAGLMMEKVREKYPDRADRIELIQASYVSHPLPTKAFDYVLSVMTLHHLTADVKAGLYKKIREALKPGGLYIEGDYMVGSSEEEQGFIREYEAAISGKQACPGEYHIDIPLTVDHEVALLQKAGFTDVQIRRLQNAAILTATA